MTVKTFFITGVSSRLGRALAVGAPSVGHTVVGTVRKPDDITSFEDLAPGLGHGVVLDVTDDQSVFSLAADVERLQAVREQVHGQLLRAQLEASAEKPSEPLCEWKSESSQD